MCFSHKMFRVYENVNNCVKFNKERNETVLTKQFRHFLSSVSFTSVFFFFFAKKTKK